MFVGGIDDTTFSDGEKEGCHVDEGVSEPVDDGVVEVATDGEVDISRKGFVVAGIVGACEDSAFCNVGTSLGLDEGEKLGEALGVTEGKFPGLEVGTAKGVADELSEGLTLGAEEWLRI